MSDPVKQDENNAAYAAGDAAGAEWASKSLPEQAVSSLVSTVVDVIDCIFNPGERATELREIRDKGFEHGRG